MSRQAPPSGICFSCQSAIVEGQKFCGCGRPTHNVTFAERTEWEVEQWRAHKERAASA